MNIFTANILLHVILLPVLAGFFCIFFKRIAKWIALLVSAVTVYSSYLILMGGETAFFVRDFALFQLLGLRAYSFSSYILLAIAIFTLLIILYSFKFMEGKERLNEYYGYILMTLGACAGTVLAADLITLLIFWGFSGYTLYMLIGIGGKDATTAAKKTFIIIGGTDALMILGASIVFLLNKTLFMQAINLQLDRPLAIAAYLLLISGALAKAGALPFHTWIPDSAKVTPASVMAFLPASLDKLVGIYFLARLSLDLFVIKINSPISIFLLAIGSITIVAAVMMALIQHNLKRLLAYHAVSQVGYMVLGIGTGIPVGIAGGIFHMLNHAIYKACLFLCGGAVEYRTKTSELSKLGGLVKAMPITFVATLVAAFSISGVPPFNGFVSKWMIYQGIVEGANQYWVIWLLAAMFGSALTMASFAKLLHATFFSESTEKRKAIKEVPVLMWLPMVTLAALCIIFGIFARQLPLKYFIFKVTHIPKFFGAWNASLATALLLVGLAVGFVIYLAGNLKNIRRTAPFLGGEELETKVSGTDFYATIKEYGILKGIYRAAENKVFDVYEQGLKLTFGFNSFLKWFHHGLLHSYLAWCLVGLLIIIYVLTR